MTTIAYRDGVIACDSQITSTYKGKGKKIHRVNDSLVGICGRLTSAMLFIDWLEEQGIPPSKLQEDDDFEAIQLTPKGVFYWDSRLRPVRVTDKFTAIGSGCDFAMGAMAVGADAKEAVRAAAKLDTYTGGAIKAAKL